MWLGSNRVPGGLVGMLESSLDNSILNLSGLLSALLIVPLILFYSWVHMGWLWYVNRGAGKFGP